MMYREPARTEASGRMTAVMRAATTPGGQVVLRVAVVRGGVLVDERALAPLEDVTVGPTEQCTLIVPARCAPEAFLLLTREGGRTQLCCAPSLRGRVETGGRVIDLPADAVRRIPLDASARGRVLLGDISILFQLAPAPPPRPRAALPASLRAGLADGIDWRTTLVAAFSFLLHFGAVCALWSDWMDPVISDEGIVADLVETLRTLPAPPPMEAATATAPSTERDPTTARAREKPAATGGARARGGAGRSGGGARMSDAAASALVDELRQIDLAMAGTLGRSGRATDAVLTGDVPVGLLDGVAASAAGTGRNGFPGLSFGGGPGGVVRPGSVRGGGLPGTLEQGTPAGAGSAVAVARPIPNATVSPPLTTTGNVPNAPGVIAGLRGPFRACYRRGLDENPTMRGSVRVTIKIGPNGEVVSATPSAIVGLSSGVVSCVAGRIAGARFDPPEGGFAILVVPISFIPQ